MMTAAELDERIRSTIADLCADRLVEAGRLREVAARLRGDGRDRLYRMADELERGARERLSFLAAR